MGDEDPNVGVIGKLLDIDGVRALGGIAGMLAEEAMDKLDMEGVRVREGAPPEEAMDRLDIEGVLVRTGMGGGLASGGT